jgi:hypothetical protein
VKIRWGDSDYVAACNLLRPINSSALKRVGELDAATSAEVLRTFELLLANDE